MQQRPVRILLIIGCCAALLLPILSIFDDDASDRDAFDTLALPVAAFIATAALTALGVTEPQRRSLARCPLVILSDPRSPPRA
jgi:hypothetical protein